MTTTQPAPPVHKAVPRPGTIQDYTGRQVYAGAWPYQYPLGASCETCDGVILCADAAADWRHVRKECGQDHGKLPPRRPGTVRVTADVDGPDGARWARQAASGPQPHLMVVSHARPWEPRNGQVAYVHSGDMPTWPEDGPAVERDPGGVAGFHGTVYRKPTLTGYRSPGVIAERGDVTLNWAFTEDGKPVAWTAELSQDELFGILWDAGVLRREQR